MTCEQIYEIGKQLLEQFKLLRGDNVDSATLLSVRK
jgi:hypothetical protein